MRYKPFLRRHPQARYWLERGIHPKAARELADAGIRTLGDLARTAREDLKALPGVGDRSLAQLERLQGAPLVSPADAWRERGLPPQVANTLARLGIESIEKLGALTREEFLSRPGVGNGTLRAVEALLGRSLDSPVREWRRRGLWAPAAHRLARAGIRTVAELVKLTDRDLRKLGLSENDVAACWSLAR
jgi:DNA-directed RNA polymerase alpha subunit